MPIDEFPDEDDEFDHNYEPEVDEDGEEIEGSDCAICGSSEDDSVHG